MADSQILLIVGLLLLIVGLLGSALELFGAALGALTRGPRWIAVALGVLVLAGWMWLPLPGSRQVVEDAQVAAYQQRVLATCQDIRNNSGGGGELLHPGGLDRAGYVALVDRELAFHRVAWQRLWDVPPPKA